MSVTLPVLPALVQQECVVWKLCPTMGPLLCLQMQSTYQLLWALCSTATKSINQILSLFVHIKLTNQMNSYTPIAFKSMSKERSSYSSPPHTQWATVFWPLSNNQAILKGCMYLLSQAYPCIIIMELIHYLHQISKYFLQNQSKWWLPWFHQFITHYNILLLRSSQILKPLKALDMYVGHPKFHQISSSTTLPVLQTS